MSTTLSVESTAVLALRPKLMELKDRLAMTILIQRGSTAGFDLVVVQEPNSHPGLPAVLALISNPSLTVDEALRASPLSGGTVREMS